MSTDVPIAERGVLTVKEAAVYLHIEHGEVRRLIHDGSLEAYQTRGGQRWRIPKSACDEWIQRQLTKFVGKVAS